MKAAQITKYSKDIHLIINEVEIPEIKDNEVLVKVKAAGVNPVDILIANGSIRLIQDYKFPLTLGNELSGIHSVCSPQQSLWHMTCYERTTNT